MIKCYLQLNVKLRLEKYHQNNKNNILFLYFNNNGTIKLLILLWQKKINAVFYFIYILVQNLIYTYLNT